MELARLDTGALLVDAAMLDVPPWRLVPPEGAVAEDGLTARAAFAGLGGAAALRHIVVGMIGPREARASQRAAAERIAGAGCAPGHGGP
ncbi:MAG: hypothetical protein AAFU80_03625 [Pseudomonadota bacterium]